jgi:hypothetical protein
MAITVILHASRSVYREVAAGGGAQPVLLGVSLQREFSHQLGPAVGVVSVIRSFGELFRQVDLFVRVRLKKIRIDAAGRGKHYFFDFGFERFGKYQAIQEKIRRWASLVQIDVAATAVVRGKMKNDVDSLHC